jgi:hypothetical protein
MLFLQLMIVLVVVFGAFAAIVKAAHRTPILKDQLIPQIEPCDQTYSLAKTQMAFWFLLILASVLYIFLFRGGSLVDSIITSQALALMGVTLAIAGASAEVDRRRDTPEDSLYDALKAIGISNYQDVVAIREEIAKLGGEEAAQPAETVARRTKGAHHPTAAQIKQAQLNDFKVKLQFYESQTKRFKSEGFINDLISNVSGTSLHRLQAAIWTLVIGAAFAWEVYNGTGKTLPALDANGLAVMGFSGAGYVGFKMQETNY